MSIEQLCAARSERYLNRVRKLVELLRAGDRTTEQLAELLFCTASGVRNYLRPLRNDGLIQSVGHVRFGSGPNTHLLRIDPDQAKVGECLRVLAATPNPGTSARNMHPAPRVKRVGQVHQLCADPYVVHKPEPAKAPRRHWLDLALFGDGPAHNLAAFP